MKVGNINRNKFKIKLGWVKLNNYLLRMKGNGKDGKMLFATFPSELIKPDSFKSA